MLSLGIGVVSALRVSQVWDQLPARMASHYGISGQPDGYMMRDHFFLFYFGIFGAVVGLFNVMPRAMSLFPRELVNLPYREYWTTDERWPEALERIGDWMAWFAVAMAGLGAVVLHLVLRSNLQRMPLESTPMLVAVGAYVAFTVVWIVAMQFAFRPPK